MTSRQNISIIISVQNSLTFIGTPCSLKAGADITAETKLHPGSQNVFGKFQKHFFAFKTQILCLKHVLLGDANDETLGNTEETLTLKVSRMFLRLCSHATYAEDEEFASPKQRTFCFLPICLHKQHSEQY